MFCKDIVQKKVVLIGPTGAGKSWLGNKLTKKTSFKTGKGPNSITTECQSDEVVLEMQKLVIKENEKFWIPYQKKLALDVTDTPGMGDTKSRSVEFLDHIIQVIRWSNPDMLIFVLSEVRFSQSQQNLVKALRECIPIMNSGNTMVIFNQQNFDPDESSPEEIDQLKIQYQIELKKAFSFEPLSFFIETFEDKYKPDIFEFNMSIIFKCIKKSTGFLTSYRFRTWTNVLESYRKLADSDKAEFECEKKRVNEDLCDAQNELNKHRKRYSFWLSKLQRFELNFIKRVYYFFSIRSCRYFVEFHTRSIKETCNFNTL